ncbi:MAG: molybdopterin molybdenumtransferase MoeA [Chloroflexi bacterium]|nr:MAG: molybdopterin molybdenumtransferase MoeA [Chloroflexota bacterium]
MTLLSVAQARERILSSFQPVTTETLPLTGCSNRVLAQDIVAANDLPPFDNSSMDGFAVRATDVLDATTASPRRLRVVADIPAGSQPTISLAPGESARIMTGAPMPEGADAVVPVEDTDFNDRDAGTPAPHEVQIFKAVKAGANRRPRGMDILAGNVVLHKGRLLKPQDLGLLAMLGFAAVLVYRKPRLALFSSGDELLEVDAPLEEGKIRDSNSYTLAASIEEAGAEVIRLGVAKDNHDSVKALLEKAVDLHVDLILSSAGVSVGAFDFVKQVIETNGKMEFWRVNMRPGKPLAFGEYGKIPFIGLPGNPVSAFVGFEVFVRPALQRLGGSFSGGRQTVRVRCEEQIDSDGRESYLRAQVREDAERGYFVARLTGHQGSGNLHSLVQANALLIIPAGVKCVPAGQEVNAWLI